MKAQTLLFGVAVILAAPSPGLAWGSTCGSCAAFSETKVESVELLELQLHVADADDVRKLLLAGEVCAPHGLKCGNLTEDDATRVTLAFREASSDWWDRAQKIALAAVAFTGLWLGLLNRYRPRA